MDHLRVMLPGLLHTGVIDDIRISWTGLLQEVFLGSLRIYGVQNLMRAKSSQSAHQSEDDWERLNRDVTSNYCFK